MKKILIVLSRLPYPARGADEQDRHYGLLQLQRLGYEISLIIKTHDHIQPEDIKTYSRILGGVHIEAVPYRKAFLLNRFLNPLWFDGASYESTDPELQKVVQMRIRDWAPDALMAENTFLWPIYIHAKKANIPFIVRSVNFEPRHFLEEDGLGPFQFLKYMAKLVNEYIAGRVSNVLFAITPREVMSYKRLGAKHVYLLPLRGLSHLPQRSFSKHRDKPLHVLFMGSTFNVEHNRRAARFIIGRISPRLEVVEPQRFIFHILGRKLPSELKEKCVGNIQYKGYVEDIEAFFSEIDIAFVPSLLGAGMQQKVFEPLMRGIPTITTPRALAGYTFEHGIHLLAGETEEELIQHLITLKDENTRNQLGANGRMRAEILFNETAMDAYLSKGLYSQTYA